MPISLKSDLHVFMTHIIEEFDIFLFVFLDLKSCHVFYFYQVLSGYYPIEYFLYKNIVDIRI